MSNGTPLSPGKIILSVVTLSLTITGISNIFINNSISDMNTDIKELRKMIITQMDDRYRRFEAEEAHESIEKRINRVETEDTKLETQLETHERAPKLHDRG